MSDFVCPYCGARTGAPPGALGVILSEEAQRQVDQFRKFMAAALGSDPVLLTDLHRGGWLRVWVDTSARPRELWVPREHFQPAGPVPAVARLYLEGGPR